MAKLTLTILLLLLAFSSNAQVVDPDKKHVEKAYEKFREEFHQEFDGDQEKKEGKQVMTYRPAVLLENWLFAPRDKEAGKTISLGVSDPGLDSTDAMKQATLRALSLAAFMRRSEIQNISDNYYIEDAGTKTLGKFNSFTSFVSLDTLGFSLVDYQYTTNGEMIALIDVMNRNENPYTIRSELELFQSETSGRLLTRLMLTVVAENSEGENIHASWLLKENSRSYEIVSDWNGQRIDPLQARLKYLSPQEKMQHEFAISDYRFDLKYGLWYAYLNALAANMEQMEVFTSQVKFLDEKFDDRFQDLTRVVFTETISFRVKGIRILDNQLSVDLERY